jgi:dihydroneopterin aldolase
MDIITPLSPPRTTTSLYRVFVRDLVLLASIGVHEHERQARQRICLNIEMDVLPAVTGIADELANVVCYDELVRAVEQLASGPHIKLAETMAERVLSLCLADERVRSARVTVEKLDVYNNAGAVGVTMQRENL